MAMEHDLSLENLNGFLVGITIVALVSIYLVKKSNATLPLPPGPKGHWLLGNWDKRPKREKGETFDTVEFELTKEFGLVYTLNFPGVFGKYIVIADPHVAKKIMVNKNPPKSVFYRIFGPLLGPTSIILIEDSKVWADKRKIFNAGFTPNFLKGMVSTMAAKLVSLVEGIEQDIGSGEATNMLVRSQNFTSDVILAIAFGEEWNGKTKHPARYYYDTLLGVYGDMVIDPVRFLFDIRAKIKWRQYGKLVDEEMRKILDKRIAEFSASSDPENVKNICSLAIKSTMSNGTLDEETKSSIIDQLKTFYFAGHDTTAIAISWCVWLLSQHPNVTAKIRSELKSNKIWEDPEIPPSLEDLHKCAYLDASVQETLRLYPPVGRIGRSLTGLTDITHQGYSLATPIVTVGIYAMHHSPLLWDEPEVFRPERFLDGSEKDLQLKFFAFSRGSRDCIGKHFAMMEVKLAISALVLKYDFECVDPNEKMEARLTLPPKNGCLVKATRRAA